MMSPRSTLALALYAFVLLQQSTNVAGDFTGSYTRVSVSPSVCVAPGSCEYKCSAAYAIAVSGSTATMYPTSNPSGCACETLTAAIVGDTASGKGAASTYSFTRTAIGIEVITSVSGVTCTGSYTGGTSSSSSTKTSGSGSVTAHLGFLGFAVAASTVLALTYLQGSSWPVQDA